MNETGFILSIAGSVMLILITIVGFFLSRLVTSIQDNTRKIGQNKGHIELLKQKQELEIESTQKEIKALTGNVSELTKSVNALVNSLAQQGLSKTISSSE